jgi:hypothetical protein
MSFCLAYIISKVDYKHCYNLCINIAKFPNKSTKLFIVNHEMQNISRLTTKTDFVNSQSASKLGAGLQHLITFFLSKLRL